MGLWDWLSDLFRFQRTSRGKDKPLVSIVLLLREPRELQEEIVRLAARRAWNAEFPTGEKQANYVTGRDPFFVISYEGWTFLVNNHPNSYVSDVEKIAAQIPELRLRLAFLNHTAWLSVDLLGAQSEAEIASESYGRIAKLVAELANDNCVALYCPENEQLQPYDAELKEALRGPDPLGAFRQPKFSPVVPVKDDDPQMKRAMEEALRRWPEFVEAFRLKKPTQYFSVKGPFHDGENSEWMWVNVKTIDGDEVTGLLDNDPVFVTELAAGDTVTIKASDVGDWIYERDGRFTGGFSMNVLRERAHRPDA